MELYITLVPWYLHQTKNTVNILFNPDKIYFILSIIKDVEAHE